MICKRGYLKLFHGTNTDFNLPKQGLWLTESRNQAAAHGKIVKVFYILPKNVIDLRKNPEYVFDPHKGEPDFAVHHTKGFHESPSWQQITGKVYTEKQIKELTKRCSSTGRAKR